MSLANLIRGKGAAGALATATPATPATQGRASGPTVATVATVNVASPRGAIAQPLPAWAESASAEVTAARWWLHFADREPLELACCPDASHAEVLTWYPEAVAAEPFTPAG